VPAPNRLREDPLARLSGELPVDFDPDRFPAGAASLSPFLPLLLIASAVAQG